MTCIMEELTLSLPITQGALLIAEQFARQHGLGTPKAEQVRRNTLAVCVVHDYLEIMGIETDISAGDSWNAIVRLGADVADLVLPGLGILECRPLVAGHGETSCAVPPEVWEERLGYVVVQLDVAAQQAHLLGFVTAVGEQEQLPLASLQPLEDLCDHLEAMQRSPSGMLPGVLPGVLPGASPSGLSDQPWTKLGQWWTDSVQGAASAAADVADVAGRLGASLGEGWQSIETLLNPPSFQPAFRYRAVVQPNAATENSAESLGEPSLPMRRGKRLLLGDLAVGLVVSQEPVQVDPVTQVGKVALVVQVHPIAGQTKLPVGLQLQVLEASGEVFARVDVAPTDDYIQYPFRGRVGEKFQVVVVFRGDRVQEGVEI